MTKIDIQDSSFDVDAVTIGNGLDLDACVVPALMKAGEITSVVERGEGSDAGRYRLTFFHKDKRFRMTLDAAGAILAAERGAGEKRAAATDKEQEFTGGLETRS